MARSLSRFFTLICFKLKEIPDFIYDNLAIYINKKKFDNATNNENINQLSQDKNKCIKLLKIEEYKILETSSSTKS